MFCERNITMKKRNKFFVILGVLLLCIFFNANMSSVIDGLFCPKPFGLYCPDLAEFDVRQCAGNLPFWRTLFLKFFQMLQCTCNRWNFRNNVCQLWRENTSPVRLSPIHNRFLLFQARCILPVHFSNQFPVFSIHIYSMAASYENSHSRTTFSVL